MAARVLIGLGTGLPGSGRVIGLLSGSAPVGIGAELGGRVDNTAFLFAAAAVPIPDKQPTPAAGHRVPAGFGWEAVRSA